MLGGGLNSRFESAKLKMILSMLKGRENHVKFALVMVFPCN